MRATCALFISYLLTLALTSTTQATLIAIEGGRVLTVSQGEFVQGVILVEDGKIKEIGRNVFVPRDAHVINAEGKTIHPGLIDANSRLFLKSGERIVPQGAPEQNALDAIDLFDEEYREVLAHGVTTVCVAPRASSTWGCRSAALRLKGGLSISQILLKKDVAVKASLGISTRDQSSSLTRLGHYAAMREDFIAAQSYQKTWDRYEHDLAAYEKKRDEAKKEKKQATGEGKQADKPDKPAKRPKLPTRQPKHEVLSDVLRREIPLSIEVHHADDILHALRLSEEFGFRLILEQCTEGYRVANRIAVNKIPTIVGPPSQTLAPSPTLEYQNFNAANPAILAGQGVQVALGTFTRDGTGSKYLGMTAALAVGKGMNPQLALRAITLTPAEIMGVSDRVGSLDAGKDADIVICSDPPFSSASQVETVLIQGKVVYQRKGTP